MTFCTRPFAKHVEMEPAKPAKGKFNKMKRAHIRKKKQLMKPSYINPWEFEDTLTPMNEDLSLTKLELGELECRSNYSIRLLLNTKENCNDILYKIYGEEINKSPGFMRNWIRLYTMTNKKKLEQLSRNFLDSTNTNLTAWIKGLRSGTKGNLLSLYLLSLLTGTHCCIHLKQNKIWSTLKEKPHTHLELMQRCNVHLAYMGYNNFIQLSPHTTIVKYKFFGMEDLVLLTELETVTDGNLSKEELLTIDMIMDIPKSPVEFLNSGAPEKQTTNTQVIKPEIHSPQDFSLQRKQSTDASNSAPAIQTTNILLVTADIHAPYDYSPSRKHLSLQRKQSSDASNSAPAIQTTNILLVTADIHAPYDYSPSRKHLSDATIRRSPNINLGYTKKDEAKVKLVSQCIEENVHKSAKIVQTKERQTSSRVDGEHNTDDTRLEHMILGTAMYNEESTDSDSTILYDISETKLTTEGEVIETYNLPARSVDTADVHKSTLKSVKQPTTKISKSNEIENQQAYKPKKHKTKTTTTTARLKTTIKTDTKAKVSPKFSYSSYQLPRMKRRKYSFYCPIIGCKGTFVTVKNWNLHHLRKHYEVKYQCSTCLKWIKTPNRFNEHKYTHREARFKCGRCSKTFYFESSLKLHKHLHKRYKTYKCFSKDCNKIYKWPQDLLRHVKNHLGRNLHCKDCSYTTFEKRLLIQHVATHLDVKKYKCRQNCIQTFKHCMQRYRHEKNCK